MTKVRRFNRVRAQCALPTKWLWFYAKILLPVHMLCCILSVVFVLWLCQYYASNALMNATLLFAPVSLWLSIKAFLGILNFTQKGYYYNLASMGWSALGVLLSQFLSDDAELFFILFAFVICALCLIPNLIYFKKRKQLFLSPEHVEEKQPAEA